MIFGAEDMEDADGALGRPSIGALPRRLALMRLILAWGQLPAPGATEAEIEAISWANSPGQASSLAADLARLMDFVETEEIDFSSLDTLVPEDLASHWEATIQFLKIVTEHWPEYLADNGLVSPVTRRNLLMAQETARIARGAPYPVIAAGSTGTVPATARLLETIASLPNGAVVLPGLDLTLDDESWESLPTIPSIRRRAWRSFCASLAWRAAMCLTFRERARRTRAGAAPSRERSVAPCRETDQWQRYLETTNLRRRPRQFRQRVEWYQPGRGAERP